MKWAIQHFWKPEPGRGGAAGPLLSAAAKVMVLLLATFAQAQNSQFFFDGAGNFTAQTAVSAGTPQILGQPQMQVVIPGELASFSVVVADTSGISYQWYFGASPVSGATSDSFLITNVNTANQGFYWVTVSNAFGSTASTLANLYIDSRGCGMPDSWQLQYFGNLTQNALGDYDGDGVNNLQEFLDGTNPTNAASTLYQIYLQNDGGTVVFSPNQTAYTNGQVVTLTAIGSNTAPFYAWTGDVTTRSNSISVVMTTNKYLYAHFTPITFQWANNNASGDWYTVSNWTPNLAPGSNDSVILVAGGTITMNSNVDLTDLTFGLPVNDVPLGSGEGNGPNLTGAGAITVHGTMDWYSGSIAGSLQITIAPGATLDFDNPSGVLFSGRTLENQGTVYWTGLGNITLNGVITNDAGALFDMQTPVTMEYGGGSVSRFDNAGTLLISTNGGATSFEAVGFDNFGTVNIQSGTLVLNGGGTNAGTMSVSAGATLNLGEGVFVASGSSSISGEGSLTVTAAQATLAGAVNVTGPLLLSGGGVDFTGNYIFTNTIVISGGQASFDGAGTVAPPTLTLSGGGALGGSNVVTIGSVMNWTGGSLNGTGRTVIPPTATLNIANASALSITSYTLDNAGTALWPGGTINMNGGVITNEAGALFQIQSPASIFDDGGSPRFDNAGTVHITGSGTTSFPLVPFNNYGDTQIQGGTLQINGLNNGTMEVSAGATLGLAYGAFNARVDSSITGAGNFSVTDDAVATLSGLLNVSGVYTFSSGFAELNGNYNCTNNTMIISGGTASFDGTGIVAPSTLTLSSGSLGGSNVVTVGSVMNWTGGALAGTGRTVIASTATLNIATASSLSITSYTLDNGGTALWSGGTIGMNGGVITNEAGALFQIQNPASIFYDAGSPRFDNAGTVRITGSGTTSFELVPFNNYSDTQIQGGTFQISGLNNGTMEVPAGTTLSLAYGAFNASPGSSITGAGNFTVTADGSATLSGLLNVSGTHTFSSGFAELNGNYICTGNTMIISGGAASFDGTGTVAPSTLTLSSGSLGGSNVVKVGSVMNWTGGSMSGTGRTVISPGATLTIANPSFLSITTRTLDNGGTTVWTGAGGIILDDAVITNQVGALFNAQNSSPIFFGGGSPRFDNAGIFRKSGSTGTTTIGGSVNFNNYGTVDIQSGFLAANGGYDSSSNAVLNCVLAGTSPGTNYGQLQVSGSVTLNGTLSLNLTNNFVPTTNDSFTVLTAGTCNGTFANFIYPSNEVSMILSNTATSVIARATNILALPQGLLWQPGFSGSNFGFSFQTSSNQSYTIQENTNASLTNWFLVTNITGDGSIFEFVTPFTTNSPQDFFRVLQP